MSRRGSMLDTDEEVAVTIGNDASSSSGVYVTEDGVETDGPNECCALEAFLSTGLRPVCAHDR